MWLSPSPATAPAVPSPKQKDELWAAGRACGAEMMGQNPTRPLENQIILAEDLWMLLHSQGASSQATLANVSARIKHTRKLLEEHDEANPAQAAK
jgi:hypothetical protein